MTRLDRIADALVTAIHYATLPAWWAWQTLGNPIACAWWSIQDWWKGKGRDGDQ